MPIVDPFSVPLRNPNARLWGLPKKTSATVLSRYAAFSPASKQHIMQARKVYIAYGDNCCAKAKVRACEGALNYGLFDECYAFNRSIMDAEFQAQHKKILSVSRGAGLWLWKPYIINKTLHELKDGEYLVYADAGIRFIGPVHPALLLMESHDYLFHGVMVSSVFLWHASYCKRDAFVRQRCDFDKCHLAKQIDGAYSFWRRCPHALAVVSAWLKDCFDYASLSDAPNIEGRPNLAGFRSHRHDQAVLTNVFLRQNWTYQEDKDLRQLMSMFEHDRFKK
jgi:hypothetical protein